MTNFGKGFFEGAGIGGSIARGLLNGVGVGLGLAAAFFAAALAVELLNCLTGGHYQKILIGPLPEARENLFHLGCADTTGLFTIWNWRVFFEVASFFVISGGPSGAVYGFALQKQLRRAEATKMKESRKSI